jgi:hypothetical protein
MKTQQWIFTVYYHPDGVNLIRHAVVGPASASTVEAAFHLAKVPEALRAQIRADECVRRFVEDALIPEELNCGCYIRCPIGQKEGWVIRIESVQEVLSSVASA